MSQRPQTLSLKPSKDDSSPRICLICIGDELLNGHTLDKNAHWMGGYLTSKGLKLNQIIVAPDCPNQLSKLILETAELFDVVITSGGIGPTPDDLTRRILSSTLKRPLVFDESAREIALFNYDRKGINWDDHKEKLQLSEDYQNYEFLPQGFKPLHNPVGMAPGLSLINEKKVLISLPGVPREFISMVEADLLSLMATASLTALSPHPPFIIRTRETPEEKIFFNLAPGLWEELSQFGKLASLPQLMGVDIVIAPQKKISEDQEYQIKKIIEKFKLSSIVWSYGAKTLEQIIIEEAFKKRVSIATAESCTGGLIGHKLTSVEGSSRSFLGSVVAYSNTVKMNCLNVPEKDISDFGAVSIQVAAQMATGASELLKADISVSTTGIAGPTGGSGQKPVGLVAIGTHAQNNSGAQFFQYRGNRDELKHRFAQKALFSVLDALRL